LSWSCYVLDRRKEPFFEESFADLNYVRIIHRQDGDGNPADGGLPDQIRPIPSKMACPLVPPRIEQPRKLFAHRIKPGDVRPFVAVVVKTGKRKIAENCRSLVLLSDDVVDGKWHCRVESLRHVTVFAGMVGALSHLVS